MKKDIKIAISGKSGCGNTTVTGLVAEKLGLKMINYTFRQMADEMGIPFEELHAMTRDDFSYDRKLDNRNVELAMEGNCVYGSRLAIWMLKEADLKIYLTASDEVRASRIHNREGGDSQAIADFTKKRDQNDSERYRQIYDIDNNDFAFADLIINVDRFNQYQVADIIIKAAESLQ